MENLVTGRGRGERHLWFLHRKQTYCGRPGPGGGGGEREERSLHYYPSLPRSPMRNSTSVSGWSNMAHLSLWDDKTQAFGRQKRLEFKFHFTKQPWCVWVCTGTNAHGQTNVFFTFHIANGADRLSSRCFMLATVTFLDLSTSTMVHDLIQDLLVGPNLLLAPFSTLGYC